jgi:prolyl oligopeptidase
MRLTRYVPSSLSCILLAALLLTLVSPSWAQSPSERLRTVLAREWSALLEENPGLAIYLGFPSSRLWPDNSQAVRQATDLRYRKALAELSAIDDAGLSPSERVNKRLFAQQLEWQVERHRLGLDLFTVNQRDGLHTTATMVDSLTFTKLSDFETWTQRLEAFGDLTDREIAVMREAVQRGRVQPQIIAQRILELVDLQVKLAADPANSAYLKPFRQAPRNVREREGFAALEKRAEAAVVGVVGPAFQRLADYLAGPYLTAAPAEVGLGRLPDGDQAYQFLISRYTTTDLTAEQVHQIGLSEVARIRRQMEDIRQEVGFAGSLEQFFDHLRSDPSQYVKDPEELLMRYRSFCKEVDGQMPNFFKTLPRKPYGVEPIPDYIAPATTTAYYSPGAGSLSGTYCVNLYQPETRALFEIPALSMHEAVPGHHHQIALAGELPELPDFRRYSDGFGDYTVFVEGWALYSESLGEEMGLYKTPYDRFGKFTYEIWRAIRLVVDTGIHSKGWTRQQAIDYFLANSPRSELDVTNEVDRYISWPGQALAYKIGELKISELRAYAQKELGDRFDLREFHDVVLLQGAVPLDQLQDQVESYVRQQQSTEHQP